MMKPIPILLLLFLCTATALKAQRKWITGYVTDGHSGEKIPFASITFKNNGGGVQSAMNGRILIEVNPARRDTLEITNVGYEPMQVPFEPSLFIQDSTRLDITLLPGALNMGVVVKAKGNRGLFLWRRIVRNKPLNDRYRFQDFSYRLYNKLELDLNNVSREKLGRIRLLRPFQFIMDGIDTADAVPYLPVYITEALSDYYYQKQPDKRKEVFLAVKAVGTNNESVARLLGGMDGNINVYSDFIPVFDKLFISPLSVNGDRYYRYKVADTQYIAGKRLIHFLFTGRHKGNNVFEGDCWVQDTSYAIQKMTLRLSKDANINYVDKLSIVQEYALVNDSTWFISRDKIVVDIAPFGGNKFSFIGRKTTVYSDVQINQPSVGRELSMNKVREELIMPPEAMERSNEYWAANRTEPLNKNEKGIYKMIDTLMELPRFKAYTKAVNIIGTGYMDIGKFQIGPWQNWIFSNAVEGVRLRFDLGTNSKFSKKLNLHGYAAYGFEDDKLKGEIDGMYLIQKHPRMYLYGTYLNDFDYGQQYLDGVSSDNLFAVAVRKKGVPVKYIRLKQARFDFYREWAPGISILLSQQHKAYDPYQNLPGFEYFPGSKDGLFNSFETSLRIRFAYLEKFLENGFSRISLGSRLPIVEVKYTRGIKGMLTGRYDYHKLSARISNFTNIAPYGNISYNVFGGRTYGLLPYMFLDIAPGNEIHYYTGQAFNMMNKYEYIHDRYAGFNMEHNIGSGLFRFLPITRKLKFRQLWTAKALWGDLSDANRNYNFSGGFPFRSLAGKPYLELGTGIDNIFKVLRFDLVYKALPVENAVTDNGRLGIFGSFRLGF